MVACLFCPNGLLTPVSCIWERGIDGGRIAFVIPISKTRIKAQRLVSALRLGWILEGLWFIPSPAPWHSVDWTQGHRSLWKLHFGSLAGEKDPLGVQRGAVTAPGSLSSCSWRNGVWARWAWGTSPGADREPWYEIRWLGASWYQRVKLRTAFGFPERGKGVRGGRNLLKRC